MLKGLLRSRRKIGVAALALTASLAAGAGLAQQRAI